ncbi:MAG: hypothetical protein OIF51_19485 [Cellvibrionaceae bacterium]|uniref:hypothetical protein n=1 Tax=uncultured Pseudoteredinibacter sp. TaxID=1641701 RepID=UPI0026207673|nr:hypothetical protein [uncultured Pseudoteredinibacter sp.]MCV6623925.1 hypothetical protein [Cellvibrionaceae bacterium]
MPVKTIKTSLLAVITLALFSFSLVSYANSSDEENAKNDKKIVCKKYRPTGTRIAKKTCMSKRGWKELKRRAQEAAKTSQRLSYQFNREEPRSRGN